MKRLIVVALAGCAILSAQPRAPIASSPIVEVKGRIASVTLWPGAGHPLLEVKPVEGASVKVCLGSIRYLMEKNFSPKAGQTVVVKGYQPAGSTDIVAGIITLVDANQTLVLRDENGWPLWQGVGRGRQYHPGHGNCPDCSGPHCHS